MNEKLKKPKRGSANILHFCGWSALGNLVKDAPSEETAALIATTFETGCRISEALGLKPSQFVREDDYITVYGIEVLKISKKLPLAQRRRNVPISLEDPLVPTMMNYVNNCSSEKLFSYNRWKAYREIRKTNPAWWPHRLRGERACQLAMEHRFTVPDLQKFFGWVSTATPTIYVKMNVEELKQKMRREK